MELRTMKQQITEIGTLYSRWTGYVIWMTAAALQSTGGARGAARSVEAKQRETPLVNSNTIY